MEGLLKVVRSFTNRRGILMIISILSLPVHCWKQLKLFTSLVWRKALAREVIYNFEGNIQLLCKIKSNSFFVLSIEHTKRTRKHAFNFWNYIHFTNNCFYPYTLNKKYNLPKDYSIKLVYKKFFQSLFAQCDCQPSVYIFVLRKLLKYLPKQLSRELSFAQRV